MTKIIKNIYLSLAITGSIAVLGSCNKKLDVDSKQSIELNSAFKNEEEVERGITGCYSLMGAAALYGTDLNIVSELLGAAGTATWYGTFAQYADIEGKQMTPTNEAATRIWVGGYGVINLANVLHDILTGPDSAKVVPDASRRNEFIGETEFIRGLMHFELVRLFGNQYDAATAATPGAVIKLKGATDTTTAAVKPVRHTVDQTYAQVIADLISASEKLPDENDVRANRFTALAFLSRVYLQKGDYQAALSAVNTVIEEGGYAVPSTNLMTAFKFKNSPEVVFEIQQTDANNAGSANDGLTTFYADFANGIGRGDLGILNGIIQEHPAGDKRVDAWYYIGRHRGIASGKWYSYGQNIPIIRMAEMYLTRAECNIRLTSAMGDTPENDLAKINNPGRTGLGIISNPGLDDVILQRRLELAFEGLNIHDLRRLRKSTGTHPWNDALLVLPIPQREIDATRGSLVQNEAYK